MKSLLKFLSPFAPDQAGAVSVFFEFGGLIVILDAGGCTGNICGFDEPRYFTAKSAIYSAAMRDMDAILGRDDKLVKKLLHAMDGTPLAFTALIGTPVPAIIATDFPAIKRMTEKRTSLPVLSIECIGTRLYDRGEEEAFVSLFKTFALETVPVNAGSVGVLGATPLELSTTDASFIQKELEQKYSSVHIYGMGAGLDAVRKAAGVEKNLVLAPAAVKCARYLEEKFGTPWEIWTPSYTFRTELPSPEKKVLIIHQQFFANALREKYFPGSDVASFFMMKDFCRKEGDISLQHEEEFIQIASSYDVIIADRNLKRAVRSFRGEWIDLPHYAVSGRLEEKR